MFSRVPPRLAKVVRGALDRSGPVNFSQADLDMLMNYTKDIEYGWVPFEF